MSRRPLDRMTHAAQRAWRGGYAWVTLGLAGRSACQALTVWLLARYLGPAGYGAALAVASVASIMAVFAGLGATTLHLRDLSLGRVDTGDSLHAALARNAWTVALLAPAAFAIAAILYGGVIDMPSMAAIAIGEVLGFAASDLMQRHFQGQARYGAMAFFVLAVPLARCACIGALHIAGRSLDIHAWAIIALLTAAIPVAGIAWRAARVPRRGDRVRHPIHEGLGFAVAAGSSRVHADADKAVVARLDSLQAAAQYSVAYRLLDVLMLPVLSFVEWRMAALFQSGAAATGLGAVRHNRHFVATCAFAGLGAAVLSVPLVYILPLLLGPAYAGTVAMGHWLALLPVTTVCWWVCRTLMATSGLQSAGATIELVGAGGNLLGCIGLVTILGWPGAVIATYAAHLGMSCAALVTMARRQGKAPA